MERMRSLFPTMLLVLSVLFTGRGPLKRARQCRLCNDQWPVPRVLGRTGSGLFRSRGTAGKSS